MTWQIGHTLRGRPVRSDWHQSGGWWLHRPHGKKTEARPLASPEKLWSPALALHLGLPSVSFTVQTLPSSHESLTFQPWGLHLPLTLGLCSAEAALSCSFTCDSTRGHCVSAQQVLCVLMPILFMISGSLMNPSG